MGVAVFNVPSPDSVALDRAATNTSTNFEMESSGIGCYWQRLEETLEFITTFQEIQHPSVIALSRIQSR